MLQASYAQKSVIFVNYKISCKIFDFKDYKLSVSKLLLPSLLLDKKKPQR